MPPGSILDLPDPLPCFFKIVLDLSNKVFISMLECNSSHCDHSLDHLVERDPFSTITCKTTLSPTSKDL